MSDTECTLIIENKCFCRIWFRIYNKDCSEYNGFDIEP